MFILIPSQIFLIQTMHFRLEQRASQTRLYGIMHSLEYRETMTHKHQLIILIY